MESDKEAIKAAYAHIGRNDAIVNARTVDLGQGRVNVVYEITEGSRTKIANINFVGNSAYGSRRLRDVISTKRSNPLSWLTRNDVYDEGRLQADEETLRRFYYNRGYADFRVLSSNATLDPSTNEYTITVTVDEGQRYTFGNVGVESTVEGVDTQALGGLLKTREGKPYSAKEIEDPLRLLLRMLPAAVTHLPRWSHAAIVTLIITRSRSSIVLTRVRALMLSASKSAATTRPAIMLFVANST